jgi:hypothetical protein
MIRMSESAKNESAGNAALMNPEVRDCSANKVMSIHSRKTRPCHGKEEVLQEEFTEHGTESGGVRDLSTRMETMKGAIQNLNTRIDNQQIAIVKFLENKFATIELLLVQNQNLSLLAKAEDTTAGLKAAITGCTDQCSEHQMSETSEKGHVKIGDRKQCSLPQVMYASYYTGISRSC